MSSGRTGLMAIRHGASQDSILCLLSVGLVVERCVISCAMSVTLHLSACRRAVVELPQLNGQDASPAAASGRSSEDTTGNAWWPAVPRYVHACMPLFRLVICMACSAMPSADTRTAANALRRAAGSSAAHLSPPGASTSRRLHRLGSQVFRAGQVCTAHHAAVQPRHVSRAGGGAGCRLGVAAGDHGGCRQWWRRYALRHCHGGGCWHTRQVQRLAS